jgi:hypothetical protein
MSYFVLQLKIERDAGRVFKGWNEGKIYFAPTYKYSCNSDAYAGETATSNKKRRTPAWYAPFLTSSVKKKPCLKNMERIMS